MTGGCADDKNHRNENEGRLSAMGHSHRHTETGHSIDHIDIAHKQVSTFTFMIITQGSRSIDSDKVIVCVMSQFTTKVSCSVIFITQIHSQRLS